MNKKLKKVILLFCFSICILFVNVSDALSYEIYIKGNQQTTVTKPKILLSDISQITSLKSNLDDVVTGMGKIIIAKSPEFGKEIKINAGKIVSKLKEEGVSLDEVGYVFPKQISVKRAGRLLSQKEVENALKAYFNETDDSITIQRVFLEERVFVSPGDNQINIKSFNREFDNNKKRASFNLDIISDFNEHISAKAYGFINEWIEVPVSIRPIKKGEIIGNDDVVMARVNVDKLPLNSYDELPKIIGKEAKRNISKGEVFSQDTIKISPIIRQGDKVKIRYQSAALTAIATGVSQQDGSAGEKIYVKNDSSNKVVEAYVIENGLVQVKKGN